MGRKVDSGSTNRPVDRVNTVSATAFVVGGLLFALGAALAQGDVGGPRLPAAVFLAGGVFFTTGAYAGVLLTANAPAAAGRPAGPWRWWPLAPGQRRWSSAVVLFVGTLYFGASLLVALIGDLSSAQMDRLVWSPEVVGCVLFLLSGQLALADLRRDRARGEQVELEWWIAVVNQLGSVLFMVAAVAAFARPTSGDELAVGVANWGTLTGALCFAMAGAMQEFDRPAQS
jgi:hypothetical protein